MLSCLRAVRSTQFWPTAKQGINNRTINPIDFFGAIIQIPINLFLLLSKYTKLSYTMMSLLFAASGFFPLDKKTMRLAASHQLFLFTYLIKICG